MKKIMTLIPVFCLVITPMVTALAADLNDLDKVSVLMPKSRVVSILGKPDITAKMGEGLNVDLYNLDNMNPLVVAGYIYESENSLGGHAFIFKGNVAKQAAERLQESGFVLADQTGDSYRLTGKDDDTGRPIVVTIGQNNDLTTVITFEKGFYDRRMKK